MENRSIRKGLALLGLLMVFGGIGYVCLKGLKGFKSNQDLFAEDLPTTFKMLPEDSALIQNEYLKRIKVVQVRNNRVRRPMSQFLVDNRYSLFICKLDSLGLLSFKDSFTVKYIGADRTTGIVYDVLDLGPYEFQYRSESVGDASFVLLTMKGDSVQQTLRSDSLIGFSGLCDNISVSYGYNEVVDIFMEGRQIGFTTFPIPMDILFCKRGKSTYLLILTANRSNAPIPRKLLLSMLS
ncbi:hypothetical protein DCC81_19270 [Chitinophaga parva]|uniref:Uncharacterized protein n=1 Tax=Chitinophaga parva TaxID=2169414 RepID=A0A2T7BBV8_9BACT|nr:hypothetical protein [Chitinophaga parva]PUZ22581.1 hypothetical protein DCC81_19270 [Chitinophaga parva]